MPSPPPPTHDDDIYTQLIAALHPPAPVVPEIEILPSSFPPKILHESAAVGVPKSLLVPLYLQARAAFFAHLSFQDSDSYDAALQATAIILLFDPNHLTAANFRKRHIQRFFARQRTTDEENGCSDRDNGDLAEAVRHELRFLESLVTSPLSKHAKSSTLWTQRLWLVQKFFQLSAGEHATDEAIQRTNMGRGVRAFWDKELVIVMKAGEIHPRNYYAWQYARQLLSFIHTECSELVESRCLDRGWLGDLVRLVRGWCLMHPRDISGWNFLVSSLEQQRNRGCDAEDRSAFEQEIGTSALETQEFASKYEWKGESIEWFLKAMETLNVHD